MFLGLPRIRHRILTTINKKLHSSCFVIVYDFLSLKKDVNVALKSNNRKMSKKDNFHLFSCHLEGHLRTDLALESDPNPDPLVRGMDPRVRIRTKMSRIPNTGFAGQYVIHSQPTSKKSIGVNRVKLTPGRKNCCRPGSPTPLSAIVRRRTSWTNPSSRTTKVHSVFIPDRGYEFFPSWIPDPGSKRFPDPHLHKRF